MDELQQACHDRGAEIVGSFSVTQLVERVLQEGHPDQPGTIQKLRQLSWALDALFDPLPDQDDRDNLHEVFDQLLALNLHAAKVMGLLPGDTKQEAHR